MTWDTEKGTASSGIGTKNIITEGNGLKISQGDRFNQGKLKWSLVDFDSFEEMVRVLEFGAKKYSSHNWKKGLKVTEVLESMQRHINAILRGEDIDPESGLHHYGHIQCNTMFLGYMFKYLRTEMDDRFIDPNKSTIKQFSIDQKTIEPRI
jgi:hypothetical protein